MGSEMCIRDRHSSMGVAERIQGANVVDAGRLSPYWGEHVARYVFALQFVENKRVLDIACGTGYGLATLKKTAASVTGVDVDLSAAMEAKNECDERAAVLLGDGRQLPFADDQRAEQASADRARSARSMGEKA